MTESKNLQERIILWKEKNADHTKTGEKVITAGNLMIHTTIGLNADVG
ncbi:MAG: hypothetical protein SCARUB_00889 [Candidatus Scalindua rubra]|uniref:Uncharacterized protein n=1 Tax=Candidatus Scalindua rubra TaxID=1872076 RepID=A0A1E3XEJ4_9BACT|nr:MAG: hypothetical protein SCARUB_00889 [Candidatus Scalindua rubra]